MERRLPKSPRLRKSCATSGWLRGELDDKQGEGGWVAQIVCYAANGALIIYNHGWRVGQHPRLVEDFNGDGKDDLVGFGADGVYVALSNGYRFDSASRWTTAFSSESGWRVDLFPLVVGDVDGDGKADAVGFESAGVEVALANVTGNGGVSVALQNLANWRS